MNLDTTLVEQFAGAVVTDVAATLSGVMTSIGDKLGLYKAMAGAGLISSQTLADKTGTDERYVREWLSNQVAGGYVKYDTESENFFLPDEHIPVLVDNQSPVFLVPALEVAASLWMDEEKLLNAFTTGKGIAWSDHHHRLFCGSEALFRPGYKAFLSNDWIKAMDGVEEKLNRGAKVADVGCGHGASTIVLAQQYPNSQFYAFDNHRESIDTAIMRAEEAGVSANTHFEAVDAKSYQTKEFDLICFMDCLHDMGDPVGAAKHALNALNIEGSVLLVEPAAQDDLENNINPVSRLYYAASTAVCTPCSKSQEVGLALGAQAGQNRLTAVMQEAGFGVTTKVAETGFNIVLQATRNTH
jgi:2-polyprenyl-3-methyl-5-hydroxy-6-metoxy-1,4-benzoquinol methylase